MARVVALPDAAVAPDLFGGLRICEAEHLTKTEECFLRRTWRERLFTWPWRPWRATRKIFIQVPDPNFYVVGDMVLCHPAMARELRERLDG